MIIMIMIMIMIIIMMQDDVPYPPQEIDKVAAMKGGFKFSCVLYLYKSHFGLRKLAPLQQYGTASKATL
jgi:hypothetical protein